MNSNGDGHETGKVATATRDEAGGRPKRRGHGNRKQRGQASERPVYGKKPVTKRPAWAWQTRRQATDRQTNR